MSQTIEIANTRKEELLREAASRQAALILSYRLDDGWTTSKSFLLGLDRSSGDLVVAYPFASAAAPPEIVEGQAIGVSFRRAHRRCVFETTVVGRCSCSLGRLDDMPALRLLRPASVFELQRRLYYRTPVPRDVQLPVQVRLWNEHPERGGKSDVCRGRMLNLSVGGLSLLLKAEDNPRWQPDKRVVCSFVAVAGGPMLELYGHMRYLHEVPGEGVRMGVHFVGLEASSKARSTLDQILGLTRTFQDIERGRVASCA